MSSVSECYSLLQCKSIFFFKCTSPCVPRSALFLFWPPSSVQIQFVAMAAGVRLKISLQFIRVGSQLLFRFCLWQNITKIEEAWEKNKGKFCDGGGNEGRVCWVLKKRHRKEPQKIAAFFFVLRHSNNARPATKQQTIWGIQMCNQPKGQKTKMCESCCSCCSCCWCCYCCCCCCVAAAAIWVRKSLHTETVKGIYSSVNPFAQPGSSCILLLRFSLAFWECECHWATVSAVNCLCGSALHLRLMSINYAQHRKRLQRQ